MGISMLPVFEALYVVAVCTQHLIPRRVPVSLKPRIERRSRSFGLSVLVAPTLYVVQLQRPHIIESAPTAATTSVRHKYISLQLLPPNKTPIRYTPFMTITSLVSAKLCFLLLVIRSRPCSSCRYALSWHDCTRGVRTRCEGCCCSSARTAYRCPPRGGRLGLRSLDPWGAPQGPPQHLFHRRVILGRRG